MKEFTECCTVIAEGEIIKESLNRLGRDDRWLRAQLQRQGIASAEEGFWGADAQVASLVVEKFWAQVPGIYICMWELPEAQR